MTLQNEPSHDNEPWGWNAGWAAKFAAVVEGDAIAGRVVEEHRTHYRVHTARGVLTGEITGALRRAAVARSDLPGVGDFVVLVPNPSEGPASIVAVLTRTCALIRKAAGEERPQLIAANVDVVFIVTGLDGDYNPARISRFIELVTRSGATPVVIANKIDLAENLDAVRAELAATFPGIDCHLISARVSTSGEKLLPHFAEGKTAALVGASGVGKSTLTNQLLGREAQATGDVRTYDSRGRHTTTHRALFPVPGGGFLIDTPGMRGVEIWDETADLTVPDDYGDIEHIAAQCRFRNCRHITEPGCAVLKAINAGELDGERVASFRAKSGKG